MPSHGEDNKVARKIAAGLTFSASSDEGLRAVLCLECPRDKQKDPQIHHRRADRGPNPLTPPS